MGRRGRRRGRRSGRLGRGRRGRSGGVIICVLHAHIQPLAFDAQSPDTTLVHEITETIVSAILSVIFHAPLHRLSQISPHVLS